MCSQCGETYPIAIIDVMGLKKYQTPLAPCACNRKAPADLDPPKRSE